MFNLKNFQYKNPEKNGYSHIIQLSTFQKRFIKKKKFIFTGNTVVSSEKTIFKQNLEKNLPKIKTANLLNTIY